MEREIRRPNVVSKYAITYTTEERLFIADEAIKSLFSPIALANAACLVVQLFIIFYFGPAALKAGGLSAMLITMLLISGWLTFDLFFSIKQAINTLDGKVQSEPQK